MDTVPKLTTLASLGFLAIGAACSSGSAGSPGGGVTGGPPVTVQGKVVDGTTGAPLTSTIVFAEVGGIYRPNADTSKGNPSYQLVATTGPDGTFELTAPAGALGLHSYQDGYRYGSHLVTDDTNAGTVVVKTEPQLPADAKPVASAFAVSPTTVAAGGALTFTVNVVAGSSSDPISEEVLLAEPTTHLARAMDPPSAGVQGKGYPNGVWKTVLAAPSTPGSYQYSLVVASEGCVTSDRRTVSVTVQ